MFFLLIFIVLNDCSFDKKDHKNLKNNDDNFTQNLDKK